MTDLPLDEWVRRNPIDDDLLWKKSALAMFEDFAQFAKELGGEPTVVSTHRSKSVILPVMEVRTKYGVRCIVRDNFHDINVSVWCPAPCNHDLFGLPAGDEGYLFFQGFDAEWQHEPFVLGTTEFSAVLGCKTFMPFAQALRWAFYDEEGKPRDFIQEQRSRPKGNYFDVELAMRRTAAASFFPVLYTPSTVSVTYRFFRTDEPVEPDEERLRKAFTKQGPGYGGKVDGRPIPYLTLNFCSGCPEPVDSWLKVLDKLVKERRSDTAVDRLGDSVGARVNVTRLTPELRGRAEELGCFELLRPRER